MTNGGNNSTRDPDEQLPAWYASEIPMNRTIAMHDYVSRQGFPTVKQLRDGILLGCIADALWLAANQGSFDGKQWEGDTYLDDNQQGEQWAVAFTPAGTVAVFYSSESERNPFPEGSPPYDQANYFRGMPDSLREAKERALSWMTNLEWEMGGPNAAITAAMWADGERFAANEPWKDILYNSLWACYRQLLPLAVALIAWQVNFGLNDEEAAVLRSSYQRRLTSTESVIDVEPWERSVFLRGREAFAPAARRDDPGLSAAKVALARVGIALNLDD